MIANPTIEVPIPATLAHRSVLIKLDGVAFLRRQSVRTIRRLVEGGNRGAQFDLLERGFEWVWNVATNLEGDKRDLRFWSVEVVMPEHAQNKTLADVIRTILPPRRTNFLPGELMEIFAWQHENIFNLKRAGQLPPDHQTPRAALEKFLTDRLITK